MWRPVGRLLEGERSARAPLPTVGPVFSALPLGVLPCKERFQVQMAQMPCIEVQRQELNFSGRATAFLWNGCECYTAAAAECLCYITAAAKCNIGRHDTWGRGDKWEVSWTQEGRAAPSSACAWASTDTPERRCGGGGAGGGGGGAPWRSSDPAGDPAAPAAAATPGRSRPPPAGLPGCAGAPATPPPPRAPACPPGSPGPARAPPRSGALSPSYICLKG